MMPSFAWRAVHVSGRIARGEVAAASEHELAHHLRESGLELIEARERKERSLRLPLARSVPPRVLEAFCARLHDLLKSGLPFLDALRDAIDNTDNKTMRDALMHGARVIANGGGIAASFALYPQIFSPVFTAIVGAGENSGNMAAIFGYLARYAEIRAATQERVRRALRYPLLLMLVAGSAVAFMMIMVVPQVVQFIAGIQARLPLATRLLVGFSSLFTTYGGVTLTTLIVGVTALLAARHFIPAFALWLDRMILRLPTLGNVVAKNDLARFAHGFALLFRSGCDVPDCLHQAAGAAGNRALRADLAAAERRVQNGASLSLALDGIVPPFAIGLLRTGERSGDLGKSLDDIATAYDREAQAATDAFIALLEPGLTLAIGGLLAWTVMAVLGPLYGSLSVLGGRM